MTVSLISILCGDSSPFWGRLIQVFLKEVFRHRNKCPLCHYDWAADSVRSYNETIHSPWEYKWSLFLFISPFLKVRTRLRSPWNEWTAWLVVYWHFQDGLVTSVSEALRIVFLFEPSAGMIFMYQEEKNVFKENTLYHQRGKWALWNVAGQLLFGIERWIQSIVVLQDFEVICWNFRDQGGDHFIFITRI